MSPEPLPEPESEQLAMLLGDGTTRLVYGLLYRRRPNPPSADEISFFLNTAASASMSTDRVIRSLKMHFDIAEIVRNGGERYELRGWASHHTATGMPALIHAAIIAEEKRRRADRKKRALGSDGT
jgi:hypothetical protein